MNSWRLRKEFFPLSLSWQRRRRWRRQWCQWCPAIQNIYSTYRLDCVDFSRFFPLKKSQIPIDLQLFVQIAGRSYLETFPQIECEFYSSIMRSIWEKEKKPTQPNAQTLVHIEWHMWHAMRSHGRGRQCKGIETNRIMCVNTQWIYRLGIPYAYNRSYTAQTHTHKINRLNENGG